MIALAAALSIASMIIGGAYVGVVIARAVLGWVGRVERRNGE